MLFRLQLSVLLAAPVMSLTATPLRSRSAGILRRSSRHGVPLMATVADKPNVGALNAGADDMPLPPELTLLTFGVFAQMLGEGIALSSLPLYLTHLGGSPLMVGLAISCFSVTQMTFA
eukprot:CAMPEP_0171978972 /NCGR_PEP_ID=MMETSP0993-20121228/254701_1 /TAXON_ID=483369 /ORGANISM="non described non described, Strain CCMP2098" /LENGTH=117 /DNA_ID=CAMNT_0012630995 /DNA_START=93 /DNA_END=443 /DNA_ORIENTATION=-